MLQPWWRLTRSQTLGAQGVVFDTDNAVLLIRHSYCPGWHFPGGGVDRHETVLMATAREIREETGIEIDSDKAQFHGLFANFKTFPGDHVAIFVIHDWQRRDHPTPNAEILEQRFFSLQNLPKGMSEAAKRRLDEISGASPIAEYW